MGQIVIAGLTPHPPVMVPEVGKTESNKVMNIRQGMEKLSDRFKQANPDLLVMITPHGPAFEDGILINFSPRLEGNLASFGASQVKQSFLNDLRFCRELEKKAADLKVQTIPLNDQVAQSYRVDVSLDHGTVVPLYFIRKKIGYLPLIHVCIGLLSREELYAFGLAIQQTAESLDRRVALIASGDLSHRLTPEAPSGYHPRGEQFDQTIIQLIKENRIEQVVEMEETLCEQAGECGFRPLLILAGSLDGYDYHGELLSYEAPFGVGYSVASFVPQGRNQNRQQYASLLNAKRIRLEHARRNESPYVQLARKSLEEYVRNSRKTTLKELPSMFRDRAGVFVSLKKNGQLRGCIGTTEGIQDNLGEEIINNAISAGSRDPRFFPVQQDELDDIVYSVDILTPGEPIQSWDELDPDQYGIIVEKGRKRGLLLPALEGIDTVEQQVSVAKKKAGIDPDEQVTIYRFKVQRYQ